RDTDGNQEAGAEEAASSAEAGSLAGRFHYYEGSPETERTMTRTIGTKQVWPCRVVARRGASGETTASITITTDSLDRMCDRVLQDGLDFRDWLRGGGPVLWAHDARALPVGQALDVRRDGRGHRMAFRFLAHDEAQKVRQAFDAGVLSASIGFVPHARRPN